MIRTLVAAFLGLILWNGIGWSACEENCSRNATFFNGQFYTALRNGNNNITVFLNGSPFGAQPGGLTPSIPALEAFNGRIVIVARGIDDRIYCNTWTGSVWTGWTPIGGLTRRSPDMAVLNTILVATATGIDNAVWVNRSVAISQGFQGWQSLNGIAVDAAQACANTTQLRVGATGIDNGCYRRTSTDGVNWTAWVPTPPCP